MSHTYTADPSSATPGTTLAITVPDDGDARTAAAQNTPDQAIANLLEATQRVAFGPGLFGDGSDGAAAFDGSNAVTGASRVGSVYTLTRDVYYTTATLSAGVTVKLSGFRLFCSVLLDMTAATTTISADGAAASAGTGGTSSPAGPLSPTANAGANGTLAASGGGASSITNAYGGAGGASGNAGSGAGAGGGVTAPTVVVGSVRRPPGCFDGLLYGTGGVAASNGGAGGGGGGGNASTNTGGGGGEGGKVCFVSAFAINLSATASISAQGGAGGAGTATNCSGGGGGGGGLVLVLYKRLMPSSQTVTARTTVAGGAGGASGGGAGQAGVTGSSGTKVLLQF